MLNKGQRFREDPDALKKYAQARQLMFEADVDEVLQEHMMIMARAMPIGDPVQGAHHAAQLKGFAMAIELVFNLIIPEKVEQLPKPTWGSAKTGARRLADAAIDQATTPNK